jgi:hypothetical protein
MLPAQMKIFLKLLISNTDRYHNLIYLQNITSPITISCIWIPCWNYGNVTSNTTSLFFSFSNISVQTFSKASTTFNEVLALVSAN